VPNATRHAYGFGIAPSSVSRLLPYVGDVADHVSGIENAAVGGFVDKFKGSYGGIVPDLVSKESIWENRQQKGLHADVVLQVDARCRLSTRQI